MIDAVIVDVLHKAGVNLFLSVPCNMLSGILREITARSMPHIPVCREEEGVGIAAGAALAGKRPVLVMQNSGLGNCINALMSLTMLYRFPLLLLMSYRGGSGEPISAQVPMGKASPLLLDALKVRYHVMTKRTDLPLMEGVARAVFDHSQVQAVFLARELWDAAI